jgi:Shikimate kinase
VAGSESYLLFNFNRMRIYLIGFMGSGKTTIGKPLAAKLGYQFVDQDEVIEKRFGMTITEVFAKYGEPKFRETEREVLAELSQTDKAVIATGGGCPCFFDNMETMNRHGLTIYLKGDPKTLVHRLKDSHGTRPLIKGKTEDELLQYVMDKLQERDPYYSKAKCTVEARNLKVDDILQLLEMGGYNHI